MCPSIATILGFTSDSQVLSQELKLVSFHSPQIREDAAMASPFHKVQSEINYHTFILG